MLRPGGPHPGRSLDMTTGDTVWLVEATAPRSAEPPPLERVSPGSREELASLLAEASASGRRLLIWGGGTHQGIGYPVEADLVVDTSRLDRIVSWEPDDLTLVVEAGARVAEIEAELATKGQTAVLPEVPGGATVGGVVAAGVSGYRRCRYGPTRDRMLEATLATGDGRIVRGGGRVVKNVSGYDLPRLATGSLGGLGVIVSVCLKLWPTRGLRATVEVEDPAAAWRRLYRPLAVLQTPRGSFAYLEGVADDVVAKAEALGGRWSEGHQWPGPPDGEYVVSIRVRPSDVSRAVEAIPAGWDYVAQHGVGEITAAGTGSDTVERLRTWAESRGGWVVVLWAPAESPVDPWGTPPQGLDLQRRLVGAFDPARVVNPGRLPGRI